jgi:hypothetical protein
VRVHDLKCHPEPYEAVRRGRKPYEIRYCGDRSFAVGDLLALREYDPHPRDYTGRRLVAPVTYMTPPGAWGMPPDLCVLGLGRVRELADARHGALSSELTPERIAEVAP